MSRLHFELPCGAAGDMILGALLDCGADFNYIASTLHRLKLVDWDLGLEDAVRSGITAKKIRVSDTSAPAQEVSEGSSHTHTHAHEHHAGHHAPHRHLHDLLNLLDEKVLSDFVRTTAEEIFTLLAEVEGEVHGLSANEVHFHELSGVDTFVDVVGSLLAVENLGIDYISASKVAVGSGTVRCAHGVMPVPAPATIKIIQKKSIPVYPGNIETELLTPTGAALLGVLCEDFGRFAGGNIIGVGYGAGDKDFPETVNAVRAIRYNKDLSSAVVNDRIMEMRFSVDDATGEELGLLQEKLLELGVLDVYALPAVMKKSRGGFEVVVLLRISDKALVEGVIFGSGLTLGIRVREVGRSVLERAVEEVKVFGQLIKVKLGMYKGKIVFKKAEFDDCRRAAEITGEAFIEIKRRAEGSL